jgi:hypothetical protein
MVTLLARWSFFARAEVITRGREGEVIPDTNTHTYTRKHKEIKRIKKE